MNDLISRQAAIDAMNDNFTINDARDAVTVQQYIHRVCMRLKNLPSAQPEQKHGRWVKYKNWYACSECRSEMFFTGTYDESQHYCYNCGARMEG